MANKEFDLPSPRQFAQLTTLGVTFAKEQQRLRPSRKSANAQCFLPKEIDVIETSNDLDIETYHKFIGRIGKLATRRWSMRLMESYWVTTSHTRQGVLNTYSFEWTNRKAITSQRSVRLMPVEDDTNLINFVDAYLDGAQPLSVDPTLWATENDIQVVTAGDCEILIDDIRNFQLRARQLDSADA